MASQPSFGSAMGGLRSFEESISQTFAALEARMERMEIAHQDALKAAHAEQDLLMHRIESLRNPAVNEARQTTDRLQAAYTHLASKVEDIQITLAKFEQSLMETKE